MKIFNTLLLITLSLLLIENASGQNKICNSAEVNWGSSVEYQFEPVYLYKGDTIAIDFKLTSGKNIKTFLFYKVKQGTTTYYDYNQNELMYQVNKGGSFSKNIIINQNGAYHYQTNFSMGGKGILDINRKAGSTETANSPTNCYYNSKLGFIAGDKLLGETTFSKKSNRITVVDTIFNVNNVSNQTIMAYNFPNEFAYRFAKGDTLILTYWMVGNTMLHHIDLINRINDYKYFTGDLCKFEPSDTKRNNATDYACVVNHEGIFTLSISSYGSSPIMHLIIERIPANDEVKNFNKWVKFKTIMVEIKHNDYVTKKWPRVIPILDE